jgi:hypothetical protein
VLRKAQEQITLKKNAQEQTKCQFLDMPSLVHGSIEHAGSIPATVVLFLCFSSFFAA